MCYEKYGLFMDDSPILSHLTGNWDQEADGNVRFQTRCRNMAIEDLAVGQIPHSTGRFSSYALFLL